MAIRIVSEMTPEQVSRAVDGFAKRYVDDWEDWLSTPPRDRAAEFGRILRKWQATRPYTMRRTRGEARHGPPFLEDLIAQAEPYLCLIRDVTLSNVMDIEPQQRDALCALWHVFRALCLERPASDVGITKAVLLLTNGRIGPAFDSTARDRLGIGRISRPEDWVVVLDEIGSDIRDFELEHSVPLRSAVPREFGHLELGRLYDMVIGPRETGRKHK